MAIFSTTVTQKQRDACDHDLRGRTISQASRQNHKGPGWNQPDKYTEPTGIVLVSSSRNIVLGTPQQKKKVTLTPKQILPKISMMAFVNTSCELKSPINMFAAIYAVTKGQPCIGCAYNEAHIKGGCPARRSLLTAVKQGTLPTL